MNWKEFLKLNLNKLFLFMVISNYTILGLLFLFRPGLDTSFLDVFDTLLVFLSPIHFFEILEVGYFGINLIFYMFLTVIYWYLLSCLIIWIYDKLKKK
jgi:hypothetical protein